VPGSPGFLTPASGKSPHRNPDTWQTIIETDRSDVGQASQLEGGHAKPKPVSTAVGTTGACALPGGHPTWALPKPVTVHVPD
jgi:hypothetical protein